jgi:tight adherence protein B
MTNLWAFYRRSRVEILSRTAIVIATTVAALLISKSIVIAVALSLFVTILLTLSHQKSQSKRASAIQAAAPEMIDLLISGIQSGLSLNESLVGLAERGPEILRPYFSEFKVLIYAEGDFEIAVARIKEKLAHPSIDQILEALAIAKLLGGTELLNILRLLGNFIREDVSLRREITVKQNWIRNSAHISAAAPWLLLLLLSTQPSTSAAFSNGSGALVLLAGLFMTAIAYLWMNFLSRLPQQRRIFVAVGNE